MFDALRPRLVALRAAILEKPAPVALTGTFDEAGQLALSTKLAEAFGYDLTHGRIDKAVHPFSSGSGLDVRITTRTAATDPFNCFYSTIHEVGHACYEQGIDRAHLLTPLGSGVSMGVHESQSRIYENQLGRSEAFTGWLYGQMRDVFGDFGIPDERAFYGCVNRVSDGFIRTEADEVQYNLHVLLRFDLERALIAGDLAVGDLEAAWNDRFLADFGYAVDKPSNGVLQDVHWSEGLFGYFPTYTLGNVYAGCLNGAMRAAVPSVDADLAVGVTGAATGWLRENVQQYGGLYQPKDLIARATGAAPSEVPLLDYLEAKFGGIYGL
jgi:carboxypeptidase Taq